MRCIVSQTSFARNLYHYLKIGISFATVDIKLRIILGRNFGNFLHILHLENVAIDFSKQGVKL